jgi:hypothetical protein
MNASNIQRLTKTVGALVTKNSPTILTALSVTGLISTAIMAVKATPKAMLILEQEREFREDTGINDSVDENMYSVEPLTKLDIIKLTWKCYIPSVVIGAISIGCIVSSNSIHVRRNAALAGLYSLSDTALKEYKAKVVETIGKSKERTVRDEIIKDHLETNPVKDSEVILTNTGNTLCYDNLSGRYFKSDMEQIKRVLNDISRDLVTDMHGFITVNEVYIGLGLKGIGLGDDIGWHLDDGLIEADFGTQLADNGEPCLVLDFNVEPKHVNKGY